MTATANKPTVWVRKRQVRERYGNCSDRTIDRMVDSGKLPPPQHPLGNKVPFWSEAELDASDKAAAAAYQRQPTAA
jgi:predicted DNA-binding transcriptional regulator AlpA